MNTTTLKREDELKDNRRDTARTFLGDYMPFAGVRYYAIFDERSLAKRGAKIGPVGWRSHTEMTDTRPETTWAA